MFAGHGGLSNLVVIVDRNGLQQGASTEETNALEPLGDKWRAFGWDVAEVDGHNHAELLQVLAPRPAATKPLAVIARTIKGSGVSYMMGQVGWHHGVPNAEQFALAMAELDQEYGS